MYFWCRASYYKNPGHLFAGGGHDFTYFMVSGIIRLRLGGGGHYIIKFTFIGLHCTTYNNLHHPNPPTGGGVE